MDDHAVISENESTREVVPSTDESPSEKNHVSNDTNDRSSNVAIGLLTAEKVRSVGKRTDYNREYMQKYRALKKEKVQLEAENARVAKVNILTEDMIIVKQQVQQIVDSLSLNHEANGLQPAPTVIALVPSPPSAVGLCDIGCVSESMTQPTTIDGNVVPFGIGPIPTEQAWLSTLGQT